MAGDKAMSSILLRLIVLIGLVFPTAAFAHTGVGDTHGFVHGFMHPLSGIDHILAMVAVGLFAAQLGGRALWLVPASFIGTMALAGAAGAVGIQLPFVEVGIAVSIITLGLIVAFGAKPPVAVAMGLVAFFAIFHGHAHGAELPADASGIAYGAGFVVATAFLHAIGIGAGRVLGRAAMAGGERILQLSGCAMSIAGAAILVGVI
jgi:urease accessory protein